MHFIGEAILPHTPAISFNSTTITVQTYMDLSGLYYTLTIESLDISLAFSDYFGEQFGILESIEYATPSIETTEIEECSFLTYNGKPVFGEAVYTEVAVADGDLVTYCNNTVTLSTGESFNDIDTFYYISNDSRLYEFNGSKTVNDYGAGTLFVATAEMYAIFSQAGSVDDMIPSPNGNSQVALSLITSK